MLKNWFKIYIHNAIKNKWFTLLTILGLAIGISGIIFSTLYWKDETSYDQWNPYKDRVYEVMTEFTHNNEIWPSTVTPLGENLGQSTSKIEDKTWIIPWYSNSTVIIDNEKVYLKNTIITDQNFFSCIPFQFVKGNVKEFKKNRFAIAIEENEAKRLFGNRNPINQIITQLDGKKMPILGVYKLEKYSSIKPKFVFSSIYNQLKENQNEWGNFGTTLLVKLKNPLDKDEVEKIGSELFYKNRTIVFAKEEGVSVNEYIKINGINKVKLLPLKDARLDSVQTNLPEGKGSKLFLEINLGLSVLILILSVINYVNLSTAQAIRRAKEVGIRKVLGASKRNVIYQFIFETAITTFVALLFAMALVEIGLPFYNQLINKEIEIDFISYLSYLGSIFFIVIVLAGIFPAIYISNFEILKVLKGNFSRSKNGILLRDIMLILQFSIAAFFIIGGTLVSEQVQYIANKELGFNGEQVISVKFRKADLAGNRYDFYRNIKQDLLRIKGVKEVNAIAFQFGDNGAVSNTQFSVEDKIITGENMAVDFGFFEIMGIKMKEGRDFNSAISSDTISNVILNETAIKQLDNKLKINDEFSWNDNKFKLIGIVSDFNLGSPAKEIKPMLFMNFNTVKWMSYNLQSLIFKIDSENPEETISSIEKFWKEKVDNDNPFEYDFVDKQFARSYENYTKQEKMFKILNVVVITIALFGLFALSSFTIERKYKEIAIRKVLGAETGSLLKILSKQYIYLSVIGFAIAIVPSYLLMQMWLENFAYRISISIWVYVFAFVLLLSLTLLVVLLKAYSATRINVLNYLKYE